MKLTGIGRRILPGVVLVLACRPLAAAPVAEYELKAALLYKVAKFVRWPEARLGSRDRPMTFCIIGADPFGPAIDSIVGRSVKSHPVAVVRLDTADAIAAASCDVAFVSVSSAAAAAGSLRSLAGLPVLTVSDVPGFAAAGGVLGMKTAQGKVRFEINTTSSAAQGLEISAQLMQLATIVTGREATR